MAGSDDKILVLVLIGCVLYLLFIIVMNIKHVIVQRALATFSMELQSTKPHLIARLTFCVLLSFTFSFFCVLMYDFIIIIIRG